MNDFFPDSAIYIVFGVCIAVLSLLASLTKDEEDVGVGTVVVILIIIIPWAHMFSAVAYEIYKLYDLGCLFSEKGINLVWQGMGIVLILYMIVKSAQVVRKTKLRRARRASTPEQFS